MWVRNEKRGGKSYHPEEKWEKREKPFFLLNVPLLELRRGEVKTRGHLGFLSKIFVKGRGK